MPSRPHYFRLTVLSLTLLAFVTVLLWVGRSAYANNSNSVNTTQPAVALLPSSTITVNSLLDVANSTDGMCTLREAITAANTNTASGATAGECGAGSNTSDTINFTGLSGAINLTSILPDVSTNMTITGPGPGTLSVERGGLNFPVFTVTAASSSSISGLTIKGGLPSTNFGVVSSGNLNLDNCVVTGFGRGVGNTAASTQFVFNITNSSITSNLNGGGVLNGSGTTNISDTMISGNTSSGDFGPGIANDFGVVRVTNSTITGSSGHYAIYNGVTGVATLTNTTISNNTDGGLLNNGTMTINGGLVTGNSKGGLIVGGTTSVNGVTITNNTSAVGGGGLFINGTVTVTDCQINNNSTTGNGGGIRNAGGRATIINTTASGNTSNGVGGGISSVDGGLASFIAINVTVANNRASSGGGVARESGVVPFKNSLIARNFLIDGTTPSDVSGTLDSSSSFNLIGNGGSGGLTNGVNSNQVGVADPLITPLQNNGGPTLTHALLPTSPALDAADNCVTEATHCGAANIPQISKDQRGFNRLVDGPDANATTTIDIGAYERQTPLASVSDLSTNEDVQLTVPFDPGDPTTITSITATSDNTTLIPNDVSHLTAVLAGVEGVVTITPAANLAGTANITVTINRNSGNEMKTFLVTVNSSNDAPTFTKGADQTINEDSPAQVINNWASNLSAGPGNESSQTLSFQIVSNSNPTLFSAGPTIDTSGNLSYVPAPNANGVANISVVLKDDGGTANGGSDTSVPQTLVITIISINDAPLFTKGLDQTVLEDFGNRFVFDWATVSRGASNESGQTLTSMITNNTNPTLFSVPPTVNASGTLSFAAANDANGSATITMVLKDNGGTANGGADTSAPQTFTISVTPVNDAPTFTRGPNQTVNNDAGPQSVPNWATNVSPGPPNEAGQTIVSQINANNNPGLFEIAPAISSTGTLTYKPATNAGGTATITMVLKDNGGVANSGRDTSNPQTFTITVVPVGGSLRFSAASSSTTESSGSTTVTVTRTGDLSRAVTVDYSTSGDTGLPCATPSGVASPKCDFTTAKGTLNFAAGESSKTITVLLNQDSFVEGSETFTVALSNQSGFSALGSPATTTVTIADDVTEPAGNPIDDAANFVRQHYHDFLNREPDQSGLDFWTNEITSCGSDSNCIEIKRVNVSAAFFLSIEFRQTGYLVERLYKVAYGDGLGLSTLNGSHQITVPIIRNSEFLPDTQKIGQGVVVNVGNWEQQLENNTQEFIAEFVQRSRFKTDYPVSMTAAQFVDKLNINSGSPLSQSERDQLVNDLSGGTKTRAQVVRAVAEDADLVNSEVNRAFVLMQYLGYLRRNPDDPQDTDHTGYEFWLIKLNGFNGNFVTADMVKAFINSSEYRQRSGQ